ncbi:MAG: IS110 family transposase [Bacillota bacterium]|nr:IS110 family transposase [Bacillota bacterium]
MNHPRMKYTYVGIDSHKGTHYAVISDCFFDRIKEIEFENVPIAFDSFFKELQNFKIKGTELAFGLEDTSAYGRLLTVFLVGKKQMVKHVNASLVKKERVNLQLDKTDSNDAECAARVLISRFNELPEVDPQDKYWVLKQVIARRTSLVKTNLSLKNHLQVFILNHYPSYNKFFSTIDSKSALAFYDKYPSPSKLKNTTLKELEDFLREVSGNKQWKGRAEKILECVNRDGKTTTEYQDYRDMAVKSGISQIRNNIKELESLEAVLEDFLGKFDYKLGSMRGIDTITAAELIAEIGDISRFPNAAKLAKYAGIAPITYSSGTTDKQHADFHGNRQLNSLFFRIAVAVTMTAGKNKKIINPFFYNYFQKKMAEGKTKKQALKCVQRMLVNIIWGMMTYKREYINPPTQDFQKAI